MTTRRKVLYALLDHQENYLSGANLADQIGVSRNAIWKIIQELNQVGYQIDSVKSKGYRLLKTNPNIDPDLIAYGIKNYIQLKVVFKEEVTSTNDLARLEVNQADQLPFLLIARKQKQGKGRRGREFYSQLDEGLYFSLALQPKEIKLQGIPLYTLLTATSLVEALESDLDKTLQIKWVNDIFYQGKKVAGILSEMVAHLENQDIPSVIIGVGLNLAGNFDQADSHLQNVAATLFGESLPETFDFNKFFLRFLSIFFNYEKNFNEKAFLKSYRKYLMGLGKEVHYFIGNQEYQATIQDINDQGHLLVKDSNGNLLSLYGQDIHFSSQQFVD